MTEGTHMNGWYPGCGWDPHFAALSAQAERGQVAAAQAVGTVIAANQAAVSDVGDKVSHNAEELAEGLCDVKDKVAGGFAHTNEELAEGLGDVKGSVYDAARGVTERFFGVDRSFYGLSKQLGESSAIAQVALTSGFKDALRDNAVNTAQIQVALVTGFKDAIIDSAKNATAAALAACENTAAIQASIAASASAAALAACTNTAAIQAAIAECCCEQKELIRAEAARGREQAAQIQDANRAAQLERAYDEINYLKSRLPHGTPV